MLLKAAVLSVETLEFGLGVLNHWLGPEVMYQPVLSVQVSVCRKLTYAFVPSEL